MMRVKNNLIQTLSGSLLFFLLFFGLSVNASERHEGDKAAHSHHGHVASGHDHHKPNHADTHTEAKKAFDTRTYIFDHIQDAHDLHIVTFRGHHVSVPLPVILYSKHSGLVIFMSSKFHHGHSAYKEFEIAHDGEYKGKIVEISDSGEVTVPLDFSITKNVIALFITIILLLLIFVPIAKRYKEDALRAPKGIQSFFEPIIIFVRDDIAKPSIGEEKYEKFMPYLLSVFFFIWIANMLGLIPIPIVGGSNLTGNIAVTTGLAFFTFIITNINGNKHYWKEIYNPPGVPGFLLPIMFVVEFIGLFTKPVTLLIRLFANITAGHIIVLAFLGLIFIFGETNPGVGYGVSLFSIAFTVFMTMLEFLVALIQAFVFTLLSAIYFGMATAEHH